MKRVFESAEESIEVKVGLRISCRNLFVGLKILTIHEIYVFQCIMSMIEDSRFSSRNIDFHCYNTRHKKRFSHDVKKIKTCRKQSTL